MFNTGVGIRSTHIIKLSKFIDNWLMCIPSQEDTVIQIQTQHYYWMELPQSLELFKKVSMR